MLRRCQGPLVAAVLSLTAGVTPAQTPPQGACSTPQHRAFDFWIGRWSVSPTGKPQVVAESLIESVYNGCGIRENWMPKTHQDGGSLSSYQPVDGSWRQTWIDSSGGHAEFVGRWNGEAMVLTGAWPDANGRSRTVRMTYSPEPNGAVRQLGEASYDGGKVWAPEFDFTYRPAAR
jgi:hypothetical protein